MQIKVVPGVFTALFKSFCFFFPVESELVLDTQSTGLKTSLRGMILCRVTMEYF